MTRKGLLLVVLVALLAIAAFAPVAGAGESGDQPVSIELFVTQTEPIFDADGILVSPPNGYFNMSGDGAVCEGGLWYDEFIEDVTFPPEQIIIHDFKVFTCDSGEFFTFEFWVTFLFPEFQMIESSWVVSASSIVGLTGDGTITERDWDREIPREVWSGGFGVFDCKKGAWETQTDGFGTPFKNQGDCISYLATQGRNLAEG